MSHFDFDHLHEPRPLWLWVVFFSALTLVFGSIGTWQYEHEEPAAPDQKAAHPHHGFSPLYHAAQMLILHTAHYDRGVNGWLEAGRWCGAAAFFLTGFTLFRKRVLREYNLLRLRFWERHTVVCGLGCKGLAIARCLGASGDGPKVLAIDPKPAESSAEACGDVGIIVLAGDATQPDVLAQARVCAAREVIAISGEDETNVRIAKAVQELCTQASKPPVPCRVYLDDIHLTDALQKWEEQRGISPSVLTFFDVFDAEARRTLLQLPIDGSGLPADDPRSVHLVLLGFGRLGRSLALRAAKMGHFPNRKLLRISVIDRHAQQQRERFLFRYPILEGNKVCLLKFHEMEVESLSARRLIAKWNDEPAQIMHVMVCLDRDARAAEVALRLRGLLVAPDRNLWVRCRARSSVPSLLTPPAAGEAPVTPFGLVEDACSDKAFRDQNRDSLARAIHEAFVDARTAGSRRNPANDPALRPWNELRETFRESCRQQADHIEIKLRGIGCILALESDPRPGFDQLKQSEIEMLAPIEHQRWNVERWLAGWRYGTPSVKERRISEYLVSWEELDPSIQKYDEEAVANIPQILKRAVPRLKVVRAPGR